MIITPAQMFAARRLLRHTRDATAALISSSHEAVRAFEVEGRVSEGLDLEKARAVFEASRIEFVAEIGGAVGVRLRKPRP